MQLSSDSDDWTNVINVSNCELNLNLSQTIMNFLIQFLRDAFSILGKARQCTQTDIFDVKWAHYPCQSNSNRQHFVRWLPSHGHEATHLNSSFGAIKIFSQGVLVKFCIEKIIPPSRRFFTNKVMKSLPILSKSAEQASDNITGLHSELCLTFLALFHVGFLLWMSLAIVQSPIFMI